MLTRSRHAALKRLNDILLRFFTIPRHFCPVSSILSNFNQITTRVSKSDLPGSGSPPREPLSGLI